MIVPSLDIYVTYRCNLRCAHCFVGDNLSLNLNFDFNLLEKLINTSSEWRTKEITFLGGEPTLYPKIIDAVKLVQAVGMKARIVTNGQNSFARFLDRFSGPNLPFICFSIDGSTPEQHERIRGKGSFLRLMTNIERSRNLGYRASGIISVSRENPDNIEDMLKLCDHLNLEYINVHYVTNRGFATEDMVLSIEEWQDIYQRIRSFSRSIKLDIRVERTFVPRSEFTGFCAVRDQSNLMFFPDGRVFMCAMFIDIPNAHSFTWTSQGLIANTSSVTEQTICSATTSAHCPAMKYVNPDIYQSAEQRSYAISCIYEKTRLCGGDTISLVESEEE